MKKNQSIEVLLLVVLLIILAGYAVIHYLVKPVRAEIDQVRQDVTLKENELKAEYVRIGNYKKNSDRLTDLSRILLRQADSFYAKEKEEVYLDKISISVTDCKVTFTSLSALEGNMKSAALSAGNASPSEVLAYVMKEEKLAGSKLVTENGYAKYFDKLKESGGRLETDVLTTTMTVEASGKYNNVTAFLKGVLNGAKNVVCTSATLDLPENVSLKAGTNPSARLNMTLVFVSVPNINQMCNVEDPEPLPAFTFPQDVIDGSFRSSDLLGNLF